MDAVTTEMAQLNTEDCFEADSAKTFMEKKAMRQAITTDQYNAHNC